MGIGWFTPQEAEEQLGGPPEVTTTNWNAVGLMLANSALGVRYILLAPVSTITVSEGVMLGGRVGLKIELGKKIGFTVTAHSKFNLSLAPPPSQQKFIPIFVLVFSWAGRVSVSGTVIVAARLAPLGLAVAGFAAVSRPHAVAVRVAEYT